jgi:HTH-type transcriptional regulator/antitoxin HipB
MARDLASIHDLVAAVRGRRRQLGLSQAELASRAGVSRQWLVAFEAGKPTVELSLVLRLLDALGLRLALDERAEDAASTTGIDLDALLDDLRGP